MATWTSVDAYLAALPDDRRATLTALRATILEAAPDATEAIAYDMPAYRTRDGRFIVSFAAFKRHTSLFPGSDAVVAELGDEIRPFLAGRGTIRFAIGDPIDQALVARVVRVRVAETAAASAAQPATRAARRPRDREA